MKVPYHKQLHDHTCGPVVMKMILEHFGIHESQEKLAEQLGTTEARGTSHEAMIRVARKYGFRCHTQTRSSGSDVEKFLVKNIPVIVNYIDPTSGHGHYAIIVGTNGKEFILNDPENGEGFKIGVIEFEKRWHNSTGHSKGWLLTLEVKNKKISNA